MSSCVIGHDEQRRRLASAWMSGRLAHAYLFVGPPGVGKATLARHFAEAVLCRRPRMEALEPCGDCGSCKVFEAGGHPDFIEAGMEKDRHELRIEVIRDLLPKLALKPALGARRVAVIDDAERFSEEAANALLKTLEEPPPGSLLLLIATGAEGLLPTIRSRCQIVAFSKLSVDEAAAVFRASGLAGTDDEARGLAKATGGSLREAVELRKDDWRDLKALIETRLAAPSPDLVRFAKDINKYCEEAGKDGAEKRRRALQAVRAGLELYVQALRARTVGTPPTSDPAAAAASTHAEETLLDLMERTLEADAQIKRYLHLQTVVDCWIDDLAQIAARAYSPSGV